MMWGLCRVLVRYVPHSRQLGPNSRDWCYKRHIVSDLEERKEPAMLALLYTRFPP